MASISSFVPSDEIRKLTQGSYEHLKTQVENSIEKSRERLFGSDEPVQVLGTFSGYAIVLSESAKVFRVKFEKTDKGEVSPISAETLSVKAYTPDTMDDFVSREAKAYVESFLSGSKSLATEHLKTLLPLVKQKPAPLAPEKISEAFSNLVKGERGWKKVYTERLAQIQGTVKEHWLQLSESRLRPKFHRLYNGQISKPELSGYQGLVEADLASLKERVSGLYDEVAKAVATLKGAVPALKTEEKDPTVKMFESFAEDYMADLSGVKKALSEMTDHLNNVDDFAKIYDVLASELHQYEVAGRFVGMMSRRLAEAAVTEEG